jgi:hypothetical protein
VPAGGRAFVEMTELTILQSLLCAAYGYSLKATQEQKSPSLGAFLDIADSTNGSDQFGTPAVDCRKFNRALEWALPIIDDSSVKVGFGA